MKNKYECLDEKLNGQMRDNALNSTTPETFDAEIFAEENADWMNSNDTDFNKVSIIPKNNNTLNSDSVDEMISNAVEDDHFTKKVEEELKRTLTQKWTLATRIGNPSLYKFAKAHSRQMLSIGSEEQQKLLQDMFRAKRAAMNIWVGGKLRMVAATINRQTKEWVLNELNKAHNAQRQLERKYLSDFIEDSKHSETLDKEAREVYKPHIKAKFINQLEALEKESVYTEQVMSIIASIPGVK
ncbi:hypothetical protein OS188_07385 [Xanthomarina sp. F1114]|uniref:hypothetical protein n=1 Tax=Xanthomarina sp. F1114 TaxID=2996019 RepID=UPI00225E4B8F|nr:hypothetical protein [Xanthomarina sp. F1114]MCX7547770.1 hypothetical protein [Xanthomarina sp. F1114]